MAGDGFQLNPDELSEHGRRMGEYGDSLGRHADAFSATSDRLRAGSSRDRSGIGSALSGGLSSAGRSVHRFMRTSRQVVLYCGDNLEDYGSDVADTERRIRGSFAEEMKDDLDVPLRPRPPGGPRQRPPEVTRARPELDPWQRRRLSQGDTPLSRFEPYSAVGNRFDTKQKALPRARPFDRDTDQTHWEERRNKRGVVTQSGGPPDKLRGAEIRLLADDKVARDENGLITHYVEHGRQIPIKEYVQGLGRQRAEMLSRSRQNRPVSAVSIDLRTGRLTEGVNGGPGSKNIPEENLHPLLRMNYEDVREHKHIKASNPEELQLAMQNNTDGLDVRDDGRVLNDHPLKHAEVKATNELLWARQAEQPGRLLDRSVLGEMRFSPHWTAAQQGGDIGDPAPACAGCNSVLHGVGSYSGRYQAASQDFRWERKDADPSFVPPVD